MMLGNYNKLFLFFLILLIPKNSNAGHLEIMAASAQVPAISGCTIHEIEQGGLGIQKVRVVRCPDDANAKFYLTSVYPSDATPDTWSCKALVTQRRECDSGQNVKCDVDGDCTGACEPTVTTFGTSDDCSYKCYFKVRTPGSIIQAGNPSITPGLSDGELCTLTKTGITKAKQQNISVSCDNIDPSTVNNPATPCITGGANCEDNLLSVECTLDSVVSTSECQLTAILCDYTTQ